MFLAMVNGIVTSVAFETIILLKKMSFIYALKTALGMSLISMIIMEFAMNMADLAINNIEEFFKSGTCKNKVN